MTWFELFKVKSYAWSRVWGSIPTFRHEQKCQAKLFDVVSVLRVLMSTWWNENVEFRFEAAKMQWIITNKTRVNTLRDDHSEVVDPYNAHEKLLEWEPLRKIQWPFVITKLTVTLTCDLMSDLVSWNLGKEDGVVHDLECLYREPVSLNKIASLRTWDCRKGHSIKWAEHFMLLRRTWPLRYQVH